MKTFFKHEPRIWENSTDNTEAVYDTVCTVLQVSGAKDPVGYVQTNVDEIMGKIYSNGRFFNDPSEIPE